MIGSAGLRWYRTGTVNVTQGSATVTGVGSQWQITGIKPGDVFSLDSSMWYEVVSVESNTSLTLDMAFQGASGNAQNYKIIRNFAATMQAEIAARVANLVNKYESFIDAELQKLVGPKGDPGIMYKGAWAAGRSYQALDTVTHTDKVYLSRLPHTSTSNNAPGVAGSAWMEFALTAPPILNTLDSDRTDAALSAAQGKALKTALDKCVLVQAPNKVFYVATDGDDDTADGTETKPFKTLKAAVAALPRIFAGGCSIKLKPGVYVEDRVDINHLQMVTLNISPANSGDDVTIKTTSPIVALATWNIPFCVELKNLKVQGSDGDGTNIGIQPGRCNSMVIQDCEISGCKEGVAAFQSTAHIKNTTINATLRCIRSGFLSQIFSEGNQGSAQYGLASHSGIIYKAGTQPTGTIANEQRINGGQIW